MNRYYDVKHFLIFMVLCHNYSLVINKYFRFYLSKNGLTGVNKIEFFVKIGKYRGEISIPYTEKVNVIIKESTKKVLEITPEFEQGVNATFDHSIIYILLLKDDKKLFFDEAIWMHEKNYIMSLCLYANIFHKYNEFQKLFAYIRKQYIMYKLFYGNDVIDAIFGEEFDELTEYAELLCLLFDYSIFLYKSIKSNIKNDDMYSLVPEKFNSNKKYNNLLNLYSSVFNVSYHYYMQVPLILLDWESGVNDGESISEMYTLVDNIYDANETLSLDLFMKKFSKHVHEESVDLKLIENMYFMRVEHIAYFQNFFKQSQNTLNGLLKLDNIEQVFINKVSNYKNKHNYKTIKKIKALDVNFYNTIRMKPEWQKYDKYKDNKFTDL